MEPGKAIHGLFNAGHLPMLYSPLPGSADVLAVRFHFLQSRDLARSLQVRVPPLQRGAEVGAVSIKGFLLGIREVVQYGGSVLLQQWM